MTETIVDVDGVVDIAPTPVSAEAFKRAFRRHPGGVAVITADPGDGPVALTLTSVASISAEPPLLFFSVSDLSSAAPSVLRSDTVVVHLLDADRVDLAVLAATSGIDRFADRDAWTRLPSGEPRYLGVENWLRCRIVNRLIAGASTVMIAEVLETSTPDDEVRPPLVHHDRTWHRLSEASRMDG
ncbi:MAG: flavin oxidoreductase [Micrococcales bacterium 73-13]|nr:MAG: flavin oxidoreductase [Micrococcales bacterium 73-13]